MPCKHSGDTGPQRFKSASRKLLTTTMHYAWRSKTKRVYIKKTPTEKQALREKRQTCKKEYNEALEEVLDMVREQAVILRGKYGGHSVQWYFEEILQQARITKGKRKVSAWNAYLSAESKHLNNKSSEDERRKVNALAPQIAEKWNSMSYNQRKEVTDDLIKDLTVRREMKKLSTRNVPMESFRDAQQTLEVVHQELLALKARTGTETLLIAVRSNMDSYLCPFLAYSSQHAPDFFSLSLNQELSLVTQHFEAYCLLGVEGVVNNYVQELLALKKKTSALIMQKFYEVTKHQGRMLYQNFDENVTRKFGVVIENWPLKTFCKPSDINTRNEVELLLHAWESGTTCFRRMEAEEWNKWAEDRFDATLEEVCRVAEADDNNDENDDPHPPNTTEAPAITPDENDGTAVINASQTKTRKWKATGLGSTDVTNMVTSIDGTTIPVSKKARKTRSDKGTVRGPRKPKPTDAEAASSSPGDASVLAVKKSHKSRSEKATRKRKDKTVNAEAPTSNTESPSLVAATATSNTESMSPAAASSL